MLSVDRHFSWSVCLGPQRKVVLIGGFPERLVLILHTSGRVKSAVILVLPCAGRLLVVGVLFALANVENIENRLVRVVVPADWRVLDHLFGLSGR